MQNWDKNKSYLNLGGTQKNRKSLRNGVASAVPFLFYRSAGIEKLFVVNRGYELTYPKTFL